jgi:DNA polymerase III subunit epsilon
MILRQIVLDTETTGLSTAEGHRLIEIGCLELINRRFTGNRFHHYINPQRLVDKEAYAVHGLSDEFLRDKPVFSAVVKDLLAFIDGSELIIHNAPFDIGFLNYELTLWNPSSKLVKERCAVIDTLVLARNKHPGQSNSLDALCKRYQIDNSNRDLHGALIDAQLLGKVYLAMTGGQDQLFAGDEASARPATVIETPAAVTATEWRVPLIVIQPTPEELKSHQEFLAMLEKN